MTSSSSSAASASASASASSLSPSLWSISSVCARLKLPQQVQSAYERKGLQSLYPWQAECLSTSGVIDGRNLVYCAPTSGGKSLVADLICLRSVLNPEWAHSKVLIVLPFISLVNEKVREIKNLLAGWNRERGEGDKVRVKALFGEHSIPLKNRKALAGRMIIVCTIEKSSSVVNVLLQQHRIDTLKLVAIDEMHLLQDPSRGYMLEILVSKLKYIERHATLSLRPFRIQTIALSATIGNISTVSSWFNASLYVTQFRPVPLHQYIKAGDDILSPQGVVLRTCPPAAKEDSDHLVHLVLEGLRNSQQVLVFCPSRNQCSYLCKVLSSQLPSRCRACGLWPDDDQTGISHQMKTDNNHSLFLARKLAADKFISDDSSDTTRILWFCVQLGLAFHHAGLSDEEREVIEDLYLSGKISVLLATSTLAAGVNLPAGRVIINGMAIGKDTLGSIQYHQMCGRAGRAGQTKYGESILIVRSSEKAKALALASQPIPDVISQLNPNIDSGRGLLKAILETFYLNLSKNSQDVAEFIQQTLFFSECIDSEKKDAAIKIGMECLEFLLSSQAIERSKEVRKENVELFPNQSSVQDHLKTSSLNLSRYGKAVSSSGLNPDEAVMIYEDVRCAQDCMHLCTPLHVVYIVTPLHHPFKPDFSIIWKHFDSGRKKDSLFYRLLCSLGLTESLLFKWKNSPPSNDAIVHSTDKLRLSKLITSDIHGPDTIMICRIKRLWAAQALCDVFQGRPLAAIAGKFQVQIGDIESLVSSTSMLAKKVQLFLKEIGWSSMEHMIKDLRSEHLDVERSTEEKNLLQVQLITPQLAKILVQRGFTTLQELVECNHELLAQCLLLSMTFEVKQADPVEERDSRLWENLLHDANNILDAARIILKDREEPLLEIEGPGEYFDVIAEYKCDEDEMSSSGFESDLSSDDEENSESTLSSEHDLILSGAATETSLIFEGIDYRSIMDPNLPVQMTVPLQETRLCEQSSTSHLPETIVQGRAEVNDIDDDALLAINIDYKQNETDRVDLNDSVFDEDFMRAVDEIEKQALKERSNVDDVGSPCGDFASKRGVGGHTSILISPYLSELTPSHKPTRTPGEYLYLPDYTIIQAATEMASRNILEEASTGKDVKSTGFKFKSLKESTSCRSFLQTLSMASCVSFELVYREAPNSTWSHLCSPKTHSPLHELCQEIELSLLDAYDVSFKSKADRRDKAKVLSGIAMNFGDEIGYFLPLPSPLPLPYTSPSSASQPLCVFAKRACIDDLPSSCKELISRFVGYKTIIRKTAFKCNRESFILKGQTSSLAYDSFSSINSPDWIETDRNPLLIVSKAWVRIARKGLLAELRRGKCLEWQLLNKIMSNEYLVKIAVNIKSQIVALRARDVIVKGPLMDPTIAAKLVKYANPPGIKIPAISIPALTSVRNTDGISRLNFLNAVGASFVSVSVFRVMGKMEKLLTDTKISKIFHMLEMPLLVSVSEAEYSGVPIDVTFFSELRQNLNDRIKLIEYYFNKIAGKIVSLGSSAEILRLKESLLLKRKAKSRENSALSSYENFSLFLIIDRLVSEWKSHSLLNPLCSSIIAAKLKRRDDDLHRVLSVFHTVGAETGRLTISSPPLQRIPHECNLRKCDRPTLFEEMVTAQSRSKEDLAQFIRSINYSVNTSRAPEWVRVSSLKKILQNPFSSSHGQIHMITTVPLNKPPIHGDSSMSLAELWRTHGWEYPPNLADQISQVIITFNTRGEHSQKYVSSIQQKVRDSSLYCYPADQVTRLSAAIKPDETETRSLFELVQAFTSGLPDCGPFIYPTPDTTVNPRSGFTANKGYRLIAADYCQIELRLIAHFSRDQKLLSAFSESGDIFKKIASKWHRRAVCDITDVDRAKVKQVCYGIIYGKGPASIAEDLGCSFDEAKALLTDFLRAYPGIKALIEGAKEQCRRLGYIETLLGRRRYIEYIASDDREKRMQAERKTVNTLCQGSAADLIKLAMVNIFHQLTSDSSFTNVRRVRSYPGAGLYRSQDDEVRFLLQIHDELLYEVREDCVEKVAGIVKSCMENAVKLIVPLEVQIEVGTTWGDMQLLQQ